MCRFQSGKRKAFIYACLSAISIGGVALPWLLSLTQFHVRIILVAGFALVGACLWTRGALCREKRPGWVLAGESVLSVVAASLWISLASYSGQLAKLPSAFIYSIAGVAVAMPPFLSFLFLGRTVVDRRKHIWQMVLIVLLIISIFFARPARRYRASGHSPVVGSVASSLRDAREAVYWVHENIIYGRAPFTDTAEDTLVRGRARCGGMANVLHAIMIRMGIASRIVHLESGSKIHTLVEYRGQHDERWLLADSQHNLLGEDWGSLSGLDLVGSGPGEALPEFWRSYTSLYIYDEYFGFVEANASHYSKSP